MAKMDLSIQRHAGVRAIAMRAIAMRDGVAKGVPFHGLPTPLHGHSIPFPSPSKIPSFGRVGNHSASSDPPTLPKLITFGEGRRGLLGGIAVPCLCLAAKRC